MKLYEFSGRDDLSDGGRWTVIVSAQDRTYAVSVLVGYLGDNRLDLLESWLEKRHCKELVFGHDTLVFSNVETEPQLLEEYDPEECPGCGCVPGDGVSPDCHHELGCGHYKAILEDASNAS